MQFDIAQSNPNIIYSVVFHMNMNPTVGPTSAYKSIDGGQNWTHISPATPLGGNYGYGWIDQGWYDLCIAVDPVDPDHVLIGNIELHRTTNGSTFTPVRPYGNSAWGSLAHMDYHTLVFAPSNPNILYIGCDGGVYKSTDKGYTATPQNDGLETMQFYRITSHPFNPDFLIGGMQDNGTAMTTDGGLTWNFITGGDGMECLINPNPDTIYTSSQHGWFYRSINGGASFSIMYNANGGWVTPLIMHPSDNKVLYTANKRIWKSVNGGNSFQLISGSANLVSQNITSMAQSSVNPSNMILGTGMDHPHFDSVFVVKISIDEGATWSDVSQNIPGEERWNARVLCDPLDANTMFVLRTGFSPENKVWKTTDLGLTWTNISGDLPDLPCNDLFIDPENTSHLYVANDIGVYRSTDWGSTWTYASQGIPFVPAIDLDYSRIGNNRYLRVGTHGRSIYQTLLPNYCLPEGIIFTTQAQIDSFQVNYPGCATITGDVKIAGGDISNLSGLNGITAMEGELRIGGVAGNSNANLLSLIGLGNLNYTGWLKVTNSTALASLNGLEGLAGIGNDMIIGSNGVLTNIEGISNVVSIGGNLNISNNTSLSTCEVQSICDYLAAPNGTIEIYNNAPGCNSSEEVEEACETTDIKSFTNQDACLVIPNPVTEKLTLYCSGLLGNIELIEIYNTFGAKVAAYQINQTNSEIALNVKVLPPGLYFLRMQAGNEVRTGKVIKH
jgi:hypothetical protein